MENFRSLRSEGIEAAEGYADMTRVERENWFIQHAEHIRLTEDTWNYIFSRVMDDIYIQRFIALFSARESAFGDSDARSSVINHLPVVDYYWEAAMPAQYN